MKITQKKQNKNIDDEEDDDEEEREMSLNRGGGRFDEEIPLSH